MPTARRRWNKEFLGTQQAAALNLVKWTTGASGAVGTLEQTKSNSIRSVVRNSAGNYTVQFNEPYPVKILDVRLDLHRTVVGDALRHISMDAQTYNSATGNFVFFVSDSTPAAADPITGSELHMAIWESRVRQMLDDPGTV